MKHPSMHVLNYPITKFRMYYRQCQDSSVCIGRSSSPDSGKKYFPTPQHPDWLQSPINQWLMAGLSHGVKRPGHQAGQSHPPSAEVKNGGAISPLPHTSS
jgi:hypothetical protein